MNNNKTCKIFFFTAFISMLVFTGFLFLIGCEEKKEVQLEKIMEITGKADRISYYKNGRYLYSRNSIWDTQNGNMIFRVEDANCLVIAPNGETVVTGHNDSTIKMWNLSAHKQISQFTGHDGWVVSLMMPGEGVRLLSGDNQGNIIKWEYPGGKILNTTPKAVPGPVMCMNLSPKGDQFLTASGREWVKKWDADSLKVVKEYRFHGQSVTSALFSPDGNLVIGIASGFKLKIWDAFSTEPLLTYDKPENQTCSIAFTNDMKYFITSNKNGEVILRRYKDNKYINKITDFSSAFPTVAVSPTEKILAIASGEEGKIRLYRMKY